MTGLALLAATIFATIGTSLPGQVITVGLDGKADHTTIQGALDAARPGDEVNVAPGTYHENIRMKNGVAISGAGAEETVIDGGGNGPVVTAIDVDSNARLQGFTITNGRATHGGGMLNDRSQVAVIACNFTRNVATAFGGGMFNRASSPTISHCAFSENVAIGEDAGGGAMRNVNGSSPILKECTFSENRASQGFGGGIANGAGSRPILTLCSFSRNKASRGGGMSNEAGSEPSLRRVAFSDNWAEFRGGAIENVESAPEITGCTFSANSAVRGGGIFNDRSNPNVTECTFSANRAGSGGAWSNLLGGLLWLCLAIGFLVAAPRGIRTHRALFVAGFLVLLVLGLAELWEASLDAAWRPDWLLLGKAACCAAVLVLCFSYRRLLPAPSPLSS